MGIDIAYPLLAVIAIFILWIWKFDSGRRFIITPLFYSIVTETRSIVPTFFYLYFIGLHDSQHALVLITISIVGLYIGYFLFSVLLGNTRQYLLNFINKPIIVRGNKPNRLFWATVIFVGFICGLGTLYYGGLPPASKAVVALIKEGGQSEAVIGMSGVRKELTKGHVFGGAYKGQGFIKTFITSSWTFIICLVFTMLFVSKHLKWKLLLLFCIFAGFVFVGADGKRAPFLQVMLSLVVIYSIIRKLKISHIAFSIVVLFVIGILLSAASYKMGRMVGQENFIWLAIEQLFKRIVIGNAINDVITIKLVDNGVLDFRLGELHLRDIIAALPGQAGGKPYAHELAELMTGKTTTTYLTGTYITKTYLDFAAVGTFILFAISGGLMALFQFLLLQLKKTPVMLAVLASYSLRVGEIVHTGPTSLIAVTVTIGIIILLFTCIYLPIRTFGLRREVENHSVSTI